MMNHTVNGANVVDLSSSVSRRLYRLSVRVEMAQQLVQEAQAQFIAALEGVFEDAGVEFHREDQFSIDWRTNTITLREGD